jgi:hypothetical protein
MSTDIEDNNYSLPEEEEEVDEETQAPRGFSV